MYSQCDYGKHVSRGALVERALCLQHVARRPAVVIAHVLIGTMLDDQRRHHLIPSLYVVMQRRLALRRARR